MSRKPDLHTRLDYARALVRGRAEIRPAVGLVLGSGPGGARRSACRRRSRSPTSEIPEFPAVTVAGHEGRLVLGTLGGVAGGCPAGPGPRLRGLERGGRDLRRAAPRRHRRPLAAAHQRRRRRGPGLAPGDLVRITDHLNLTGANPLTGPNDDRLGPALPGHDRPYDTAPGRAPRCLRRAARHPARRGLRRPGRAELRDPGRGPDAAALGADLVGMSTVLEVIAARHAGRPGGGGVARHQPGGRDVRRRSPTPR